MAIWGLLFTVWRSLNAKPFLTINVLSDYLSSCQVVVIAMAEARGQGLLQHTAAMKPRSDGPDVVFPTSAGPHSPSSLHQPLPRALVPRRFHAVPPRPLSSLSNRSTATTPTPTSVVTVTLTPPQLWEEFCLISAPFPKSLSLLRAVLSEVRHVQTHLRQRSAVLALQSALQPEVVAEGSEPRSTEQQVW